MVGNPVQQTIQGGISRRLGPGAQMRVRVWATFHWWGGRSWMDGVWLSLTPWGYINSMSAGAIAKLLRSTTSSY